MVKILKGSTFLNIDDVDSNVAYFTLTKDQVVETLTGTNNPNNLWHLYEVIMQTTEISEGTVEEFKAIRDVIAEEVSINDFFTVLTYCFIRKYFDFTVLNKLPKRVIHFLQLFKIYKVYKDTGNFVWEYDLDKMKLLRRTPYTMWEQKYKDEFKSLKDLMISDFNIDFEKFFENRSLRRDTVGGNTLWNLF